MDMNQQEGIPPGCSQEGQGCLLPRLSDDGARALALRSLIVRLGRLVDAGAVMRITRAGRADLMLLAEAEDALEEMAEEMADDKDRD